MPSRPIVVWDACVFLGVFTNNADGSRTDDEMDNLLACVADIDGGHLQLVVPSTLFSEVLSAGMSPEQYAQFELSMQRRQVTVIDVSAALSKRAGKLREIAKNKGISLKSADSIYVATADMAPALELHSFDATILKCNGLTGPHFKVCKPHSLRGPLDVPLPFFTSAIPDGEPD